MKTVKSDFNKRDRLDMNIFTDCWATKNLCDKWCKLPEKISDKSITGFIQEITQTPFGFLMLSDIQVCVFEIFFVKHIMIQEKNWSRSFK